MYKLVNYCLVTVGGQTVIQLCYTTLINTDLAHDQKFPAKACDTWARGYKTFFMLNSTEHEIFLLINVKMPTIVGILTFMSGKNSIPALSELKKSRIS